MPKKYPVLTRSEIIEILRVNHFALNRQGATSHAQYLGTTRGKRRLVSVDMSIDEYGNDLLRSVIAQSGLSRDEFYCSIKSAAKKINKRCKS